MPEKHLFEYAVIRFVPRVEREEFVNIGVIVYCKSLRFLQTRFTIDQARIDCLCNGLDCAELNKHLQSFEEISKGLPGAGPIARLETSLRFRWLTAQRSTVVQTSRVHPGLTDDPVETLTRLHEMMVLPVATD